MLDGVRSLRKSRLALAAAGHGGLGAGTFEVTKGQTCRHRLASQTSREYVRTAEPASEEEREGRVLEDFRS